MKFLVLELQSDNDTVATLINQYDTLNDARSAYHRVLSYAAVSEVEHHSAVLMNADGAVYYNESFEHPKPILEPEPVEEETSEDEEETTEEREETEDEGLDN